jgi:hypothetical protein
MGKKTDLLMDAAAIFQYLFLAHQLPGVHPGGFSACGYDFVIKQLAVQECEQRKTANS